MNKETKQKTVEDKNEAEEILDRNCQLFDIVANKGYDTEISVALFTEVSRELRANAYKKERQQNFKEKSDKPTQKQINYAKTLNIINPENMTRQEISKAIDNALGKGN